MKFKTTLQFALVCAFFLLPIMVNSQSMRVFTNFQTGTTYSIGEMPKWIPQVGIDLSFTWGSALTTTNIEVGLAGLKSDKVSYIGGLKSGIGIIQEIGKNWENRFGLGVDYSIFVPLGYASEHSIRKDDFSFSRLQILTSFSIGRNYIKCERGRIRVPKFRLLLGVGFIDNLENRAIPKFENLCGSAKICLPIVTTTFK